MLFGIAASLLLAVHADVHAPAPVAPAPVPQIGSQVDLPPMPGGSALLQGFGNPFRQYEGGSIPGWMYGGDATLFNDYLSLTPAAPHSVCLASGSSTPPLFPLLFVARLCACPRKHAHASPPDRTVC